MARCGGENIDFDQTQVVMNYIKGEGVLLLIGYAIILPTLASFEAVLGIWMSRPDVAVLLLALTLPVIPMWYFTKFLSYPLRIVTNDGVITLFFRFRSTPRSISWSNINNVIAMRLRPHRFRRFTFFALRFHEKGLRGEFSKVLADESTYGELRLWLSRGGISVRGIGDLARIDHA